MTEEEKARLMRLLPEAMRKLGYRYDEGRSEYVRMSPNERMRAEAQADAERVLKERAADDALRRKHYEATHRTGNEYDEAVEKLRAEGAWYLALCKLGAPDVLKRSQYVERAALDGIGWARAKTAYRHALKRLGYRRAFNDLMCTEQFWFESRGLKKRHKDFVYVRVGCTRPLADLLVEIGAAKGLPRKYPTRQERSSRIAAFVWQEMHRPELDEIRYREEMRLRAIAELGFDPMRNVGNSKKRR